MGRLIPIMLIIAFLFLPLNNVVATTPNNGYFRKGYRVDFVKPDLLLDCGSFFYLNVTLYKMLPAPPVSIYVYFRTVDDYGRQKTQLIGYLPFARVGVGDEKSFLVPCFTSMNLLHKIACLKEGKKEEWNPKKAYIGVKLKYASITIKDLIAWIIMKRLRNNFMSEEFWKWAIVYGIVPLRITRNIAFAELWNNRISCLRKFDFTMVWKKIEATSPFVYSNKIDFNVSYFDKNTTKDGSFRVVVNVINKLNRDIRVLVLADLTPEQFINSLFPTARETRYNVGYAVANISAGDNVTLTLNCKFPGGGWLKKKYLIRLECGPFIDIGKSNQFGIYTYNIRWGVFIKPNYKVNGEVQEEIKNVWYNLPIFYSNGPDIFPTHYIQVNYTGATPEEELKSMVRNATENITNAAILFFSAIAIIVIVMPFVLYILIRRKYL